MALATLTGWPRRLAAVGCLLAAAVSAARGQPPDNARPRAGPAVGGIPLVVAAHDLAAGTALVATDVRLLAVPSEFVPAGAVRRPAAVLGRVVAGPVRRGEPLTDARVLGPGLADGLRVGESVAVPVRLADAQAAGLARAGDRVDLLAIPPAAGRSTGPPDATRDATLVAAGVRVLAVIADPHAAATDGVVVVVAVSDAAARRLAGAAGEQRLSLALRPP
jgi:Flp pilus assembly protein CpaB